MSIGQTRTLYLKTLNNINGIRDVHVDPESNISSLRQYEGNDCIFLYKGMKLVDTLTFKFYSMTDGDIICTVYPTPKTIFANTISKYKLVKDMDLEKQKICELQYSRIEMKPDFYRKNQKQRVEYLENIDAPFKFNRILPLFTPPKPQTPCAAPLPKFWIQ
ncbi:hypothetical protein TVAG_431910 [Trichomonas vaginalis G3]|uniref:Ubiquitin-like domain-containing protein n=1 Tax=Trichomonas vaginalis (strain ATCC PRA-98 / G3) TaxID=412133 RepID=A2F7Y8_TRIV3|nr:ubiquitin-like family [Trichomonas vaginalis G3]EAX98982.1 hypothetical protein TVAG_431910 [Trichomonas vaginalis G3]KAI5507238.1 ubiquitin-like family [Trichomonas vaginalis G3]|eukprot:XP_001311912.1 hypothetical protein [Trichomonas vaginalis G3]